MFPLARTRNSPAYFVYFLEGVLLPVVHRSAGATLRCACEVYASVFLFRSQDYTWHGNTGDISAVDFMGSVRHVVTAVGNLVHIMPWPNCKALKAAVQLLPLPHPYCPALSPCP